MQAQQVVGCTTPPPYDDIACNSDVEQTEATGERGSTAKLSPHASAMIPTAGRPKKGAQDPSQGFANIISSKIEELEKSMGTAGVSQGERDTLKARKKQLREVTKYVTDKAHSAEDRITFLQTKYTAAVQELLKMDKHQLDTQMQLEMATKDRDKAQEGLRRTNMLRDKLEELCRQLQKENKEVLEEARRVRDEETAARAAQQARLQAAIADVTVKMDAQAADRMSQLEENDNLRNKLGDVLSQLETFNQLVTKKEEETRLAQLRVEQQAAVCDALTRKNQLLEEANAALLKAHQASTGQLESLVESQRANLILAQSNKELKEQLDSYYSKFNEFQSTLTKSNQMFDSLKKELDTSARLRVAVVRERDEQRRKAEAAATALTALTQDKQALTAQVSTLKAQVCAVEGVDAEEVRRIKGQKEALEGLCRTLTAQLKAIKATGGNSSACNGSPSAVTTPAAPSSPQGRDGVQVERLARGTVSGGGAEGLEHSPMPPVGHVAVNERGPGHVGEGGEGQADADGPGAAMASVYGGELRPQAEEPAGPPPPVAL